MVKVGVTGGLGSGKSAWLELLHRRGIPVADADQIAKRCLEDNAGLMHEIKRRFGEDLYAQGKLNRAALAGRAFTDRAAQEELNHLVHPVVAQEISLFFQKCEKAGHKLAAVEASMLLEAGHASVYDRIVLVTAPEKLRVHRALERGSLSREQILSRMALQMPEEKKRGYAHLIIENTGTLLEMEADLDEQLEILLATN